MSTGPQGTLTVGWSDFLGIYGLNPTVHGGNAIWLGGYAAGDHLMKFNTDFEMLPQLAKSWSQSDDGLVWTFNLEEGVQFHKGYGEMTADDVIFSFQQYAAEGSLHHSNAIMRRLWANPDGWVKAPDPYTVQVHTGTFQWDMPFNLSNDKPTFSKSAGGGAGSGSRQRPGRCHRVLGYPGAASGILEVRCGRGPLAQDPRIRRAGLPGRCLRRPPG